MIFKACRQKHCLSDLKAGKATPFNQMAKTPCYNWPESATCTAAMVWPERVPTASIFCTTS